MLGHYDMRRHQNVDVLAEEIVRAVTEDAHVAGFADWIVPFSLITIMLSTAVSIMELRRA